nr:putative phage tail protein [uncultured Clostridium sp.]
MYNREIDLRSYIPDYLKDYEEFKVITDLEKEDIVKLREACNALWNDGFISTAGYQGIKKWETLLGIRSEPRRSLEERRAAVLAGWSKQLPYTEQKLRERLMAMLGSDYELYIRNSTYELKLVVIERPQFVVKSIQKMVHEMIPANLNAGFFSKYQGNYKVPVSGNNSIHFHSAFYPHYNLPHLYLDNIWSLDGSRKFNGYDSGDFIDFYPVKFRVRAETTEAVHEAEMVRASMNAAERINIMAEVFKFEAGVKENIQNIESIAIASGIIEQTTAGPVRVMNRNVMDNNWKLDGGRRLNGGFTIL